MKNVVIHSEIGAVIVAAGLESPSMPGIITGVQVSVAALHDENGETAAAHLRNVQQLMQSVDTHTLNGSPRRRVMMDHQLFCDIAERLAKALALIQPQAMLPLWDEVRH